MSCSSHISTKEQMPNCYKCNFVNRDARRKKIFNLIKNNLQFSHILRNREKWINCPSTMGGFLFAKLNAFLLYNNEIWTNFGAKKYKRFSEIAVGSTNNNFQFRFFRERNIFLAFFWTLQKRIHKIEMIFTTHHAISEGH